MHDHIETDEQIKYSNNLIHTCAEKILEISTNDSYRSLANLSLALVYSEATPTPENLAQCKMYADKVLYKDMYHTLYPLFGLHFNDPATFRSSYSEASNLLSSTNGIIKNVLHFSKRLDKDTLDSINFNQEALEVFQQHLGELIEEWKHIIHD